LALGGLQIRVGRCTLERVPPDAETTRPRHVREVFEHAPCLGQGLDEQ
ncbi:MAG: hypothetical protein JWP87_5245, partial [Labilithrix sp.]|nr:hypothetical protein [Labilithrix sp.]